jgi:hypothetical protein
VIQNTTDFPRGSEWRRWDLHVHSPASANFHGDWHSFIIQLGNADCAVIGINDYFSVAGYKELRRRLADPAKDDSNQAYRDALEKLRFKTLLPVVECRMTNIVIGKKGSGPRRLTASFSSRTTSPMNDNTSACCPMGMGTYRFSFQSK